MLSHQLDQNINNTKTEKESSIFSRLIKHLKITIGLTTSAESICSGDVCYRPQPVPQNIFVENRHATPLAQKTMHSNSSSADHEMCAAAPIIEKPFMHPTHLSFFLCFPEELITHVGRQFEFKEEKTYLANQVMRALTMLQLAKTSPEQTLLIPTASFLLKKCLSLKFNENLFFRQESTKINNVCKIISGSHIIGNAVYMN